MTERSVKGSGWSGGGSVGGTTLGTTEGAAGEGEGESERGFSVLVKSGVVGDERREDFVGWFGVEPRSMLAVMLNDDDEDGAVVGGDSLITRELLSSMGVTVGVLILALSDVLLRIGSSFLNSWGITLESLSGVFFGPSAFPDSGLLPSSTVTLFEGLFEFQRVYIVEYARSRNRKEPKNIWFSCKLRNLYSK